MTDYNRTNARFYTTVIFLGWRCFVNSFAVTTVATPHIPESNASVFPTKILVDLASTFSAFESKFIIIVPINVTIVA